MGLDLDGFAQAARKSPQPKPATSFTAVVVRAGAGGLFVAPVGDDVRHPIGPCRGGWLPTGGRVPKGTTVLLVMTDDGPWVAAHDDPALYDIP